MIILSNTTILYNIVFKYSILIVIIAIIKLTDSINHMIYNSLMPAKNQILLVMWCHIAAHQLNDINRISLHTQLNILLFRAKCYDLW